VLYWAGDPRQSAIFFHIVQAWQWFKAFLAKNSLFWLLFSNSKCYVTNSAVFSQECCMKNIAM